MGCVYRYINKKTGIIEYVGIVYNRPLYKRIKEHAFSEKWYSSKYKVEYVSCSTKTDLEYLEAHLIAKWKTYNYNNIAKKNMGVSYLIDDSSLNWTELDSVIVDGYSIKEVANHYADIYIKTTDEEKAELIHQWFENIKGEENKVFFYKVKDNMPQYIRQKLFGTSNEMIEISIDYKYLVVSLKYVTFLTEAFYMTTDDFVYVRNGYLNKSVIRKIGKLEKKEYHMYLKGIINSFSALERVFD